jgi:hypothetical protein
MSWKRNEHFAYRESRESREISEIREIREIRESEFRGRCS